MYVYPGLYSNQFIHECSGVPEILLSQEWDKCADNQKT